MTNSSMSHGDSLWVDSELVGQKFPGISKMYFNRALKNDYFASWLFSMTFYS